MKKSSSNNKTVWLFYIIASYVLLQIAWWSYLLIDLNIELEYLKNIDISSSLFIQRKVVMVVGEGIIFALLFILGLYKIKKSFKRELELNNLQKNFLMSVTHELKTPIAATKIILETLQKRKEISENKRNELIGKSISENERILALVENILLASQLEYVDFKIIKTKINLSKFIEKFIEQHSSINTKNCKINIEIQPNVKFEADELALTSILSNLYENAIKYSEENTIISFYLTKIENKIVLAIKDEGSGIADNKKKEVFEKFYRIKDVSSKNIKGTGLGLFIVNYLVKLHNGTIIIKNNKPKGSVFEITFVGNIGKT